MMLEEPELREINITLECRKCGETVKLDMKAPGARERYEGFYAKHPAFCKGEPHPPLRRHLPLKGEGFD